MAEEQCSRRLPWADTLKGILILAVLLHHSNPPALYNRLVSPVFLTMFYFISGVTFRPSENYAAFLKKKAYGLLLPFLLLGLIRVGLSLVFIGETLSQRLIWFFLQQRGVGDEMWFLLNLFLSFVLADALLRLAKKIHPFFILLITVALFAGGFALLGFLHIKLYWEIELCFFFLPFFLLGYVWRQNESRLSMLKRPVVIVIFSVVYLLLCIFFSGETDIHSGNFDTPVQFLCCAFLGILPLPALSERLQNIRFLRFLGKNTLLFYAFGGFGREVADRLFALAKLPAPNDYLMSLLSVVLSVLLLSLPAVLIRRYLPFLIGAKKASKKEDQASA